jgi:hypothetical protein
MYPLPASNHHPAWLAAMKSAPTCPSPRRRELRIDPVTATPSDRPTCRLAEEIPDATPACALGMPDTAVVVIAALSMPDPMPKSS